MKTLTILLLTMGCAFSQAKPDEPRTRTVVINGVPLPMQTPKEFDKIIKKSGAITKYHPGMVFIDKFHERVYLSAFAPAGTPDTSRWMAARIFFHYSSDPSAMVPYQFGLFSEKEVDDMKPYTSSLRDYRH